jgi:hypothetical protein
VDGFSRVVPRGAVLRVPSVYSVNNGDLKSGGTTTFERSAVFNSSGSIYFSGTTRIVAGASIVLRTAAVIFPNSSVLEVKQSKFMLFLCSHSVD